MIGRGHSHSRKGRIEEDNMHKKRADKHRKHGRKARQPGTDKECEPNENRCIVDNQIRPLVPIRKFQVSITWR